MIEYKVRVYANCDKFWYLNDNRHREDGPAFEGASGDKAWYLDGEKLTQEEWEKRLKNPNRGKVVGFEGVKYKLVEV